MAAGSLTIKDASEGAGAVLLTIFGGVDGSSAGGSGKVLEGLESVANGFGIAEEGCCFGGAGGGLDAVVVGGGQVGSGAAFLGIDDNGFGIDDEIGVFGIDDAEMGLFGTDDEAGVFGSEAYDFV